MTAFTRKVLKVKRTQTFELQQITFKEVKNWCITLKTLKEFHPDIVAKKKCQELLNDTKEALCNFYP